MVSYKTYPPPEELISQVRFFWSLESDLSGYIHRSMADVCGELIFHYKGKFSEMRDNGLLASCPTAEFHAATDQTCRFVTNERFGIFGVYLYPEAIANLSGMSAKDLINQAPGLGDIWNNEGRELEEKVMLSNSNFDRIEIVTQFLKRRLRHCDHGCLYFPPLRYLLESTAPIKIEDLARKFNTTTRQLERKFQYHAGLSPKLFSRIVRFHRAFNTSSREHSSLTSIAYSCGYFDQSHFAADFKQFSGLNPKTFYKGGAEGRQWME